LANTTIKPSTITRVGYPDRLPQFFRRYIDTDDWRYADECLQEFVSVQGFSSEYEIGLVETFLDWKTLEALGEAGAKQPLAKSLHAKQVAFLGGEPEDRHDRRGT
jgi:hypothetical protein